MVVDYIVYLGVACVYNYSMRAPLRDPHSTGWMIMLYTSKFSCTLWLINMLHSHNYCRGFSTLVLFIVIGTSCAVLLSLLQVYETHICYKLHMAMYMYITAVAIHP